MSVAKRHETGIASAAARADLEKQGWKTKYDSKDSVCDKTGRKVHEETLDATRQNDDDKTTETLESKSKKVVGDNFRSEVVSQSYTFKRNLYDVHSSSS